MDDGIPDDDFDPPVCAVCGKEDEDCGGMTVGSVDAAIDHDVEVGDYVCRGCWLYPEDFDDADDGDD